MHTQNDEFINQGNHLISNFVGAKVQSHRELSGTVYYEHIINGKMGFCHKQIHGIIRDENIINVNNLRYHADWNWFKSAEVVLNEKGYYIHSTAHDLKIVEYLSGNEKIVASIEIDTKFPPIYNHFSLLINFLNTTKIEG